MEIAQTLKRLPHRPGVYIFKDRSSRVLYVGKAIDLSRRVLSYFQAPDLFDWKSRGLASLTKTIETVETVSEFDALTLEAKLINDYQPKYNVIAKDDKSYLYVVLTFHEPLPRVLFARKRELSLFLTPKKDRAFGPFQSARIARSVMRELRTIVPFCLQKQRNGKPCFYTHLGLCEPCPSVIAKTEDPAVRKKEIRLYRDHIYRLAGILSGKTKNVLKQMEKEMRSFAESQEYEEAAVSRNHIASLYKLLERHYDPAVYLHDRGAVDIYASELTDLRKILQPYIPNIGPLSRIECVDISNTSGTSATGSLVVLTGGSIDKSAYRRFRVKTLHTPNDTAMIAEVILRRFKHTEWPFPELLAVDGGKGQVSAARHTLQTLSLEIPIIGLAKRREEIIVPKKTGFVALRLDLDRPGLHVLERIRDEAHRFALRYHRLLRSKTTFANTSVKTPIGNVGLPR